MGLFSRDSISCTVGSCRRSAARLLSGLTMTRRKLRGVSNFLCAKEPGPRQTPQGDKLSLSHSLTRHLLSAAGFSVTARYRRKLSTRVTQVESRLCVHLRTSPGRRQTRLPASQERNHRILLLSLLFSYSVLQLWVLMLVTSP